jgi:LuxR family maltose regulon positive regulatory protein
VTRRDPPLRLPRLRLADGLSQIRQGPLAFTEHEAAQLLKQAGATLDAHEIATLWRRTEGWAARVAAGALSLRDHPEPEAHVAALAASDQTVADYLVEELLDGQPADQRAFLLRTSIVDDLTGALADALTEGCDGAARLADLVRRNAMVTPLGGPGGWFTYHPLLREMLRAELRAQRATSGARSIAGRRRGWPSTAASARRCVMRAPPTTPTSWRASSATAGPSSSWRGARHRLRARRPRRPEHLAADPEIALAGVAGHLATGRFEPCRGAPRARRRAVPAEPGARLAGLHAAARLYDRRLRGADRRDRAADAARAHASPHDDPRSRPSCWSSWA